MGFVERYFEELGYVISFVCQGVSVSWNFFFFYNLVLVDWNLWLVLLLLSYFSNVFCLFCVYSVVFIMTSLGRKMIIDGEVEKPSEGVHYDFDLFVIGAGSGGVRASRFSAQYGAKVHLQSTTDIHDVPIGCSWML